MIDAAKAAVSYVNEELGGVNGHPLNLEVCETRETPDSMNACASELAQKNPVAVIGGPELNAAASINQVFGPQGIPVIGGLGLSPAEFVPPTSGGEVDRSMFVGGPVALFPGITSWSVDFLHAKHVVLITNASPTTPQQVNSFVNPVLKQAGVPNADVVTVPPGTADYTPYVTAALSKKPDVLLGVGLGCIPLINAYHSSGTHVPLVQPDNCSDPSTLKQAGAAADGVYYVVQIRTPALDAKNKDVRAYVAATEKYAKDAEQLGTDFALAAFQAVMNIRDLAATLKDNVTKDGLAKAVRAAANQSNFLGLSATYSCSPVALPPFPAICNSDSRLAQVKDGKIQYVSDDVLSGAALLSGAPR
jgi:branched-chain amino acid transport system substrate-binding protein